MAQLSFNSIDNINNTNQQNSNSVAFFSLKNDGDEAIVRIMHDTVESFDLVSKHQVKINNRFFNVNCVRDPSSSVEACPLCAAGYNLENKIFIHMLRYNREQDGRISCMPVVWERSLAYAKQLQSLINEYGNLSDYIFKIKRHGAPGSRDTTYDILFVNQVQYNSPEFAKNASLFDGYRALGRAVLDKNINDINVFLQTGDFPKKQETTQTNQAMNNQMNNQNNYSQPIYNQQDFTRQQTPDHSFVQENPFTQSNPFQNEPQVQRPVRIY